MTDNSASAIKHNFGLERIAALFPDELRAAEHTAAAEHAALERVDDPGIEPA